MSKIIGHGSQDFIHNGNDQWGDHHCQHNTARNDTETGRLVDFKDRNKVEPPFGERR